MVRKSETYWASIVDEEIIDKEFALLNERVARGETVEVERRGGRIIGYLIPTDKTKVNNVLRTKVIAGQHAADGDRVAIIDAPEDDDKVIGYYGTSDGDYVNIEDERVTDTLQEMRSYMREKYGIDVPINEWKKDE